MIDKEIIEKAGNISQERLEMLGGIQKRMPFHIPSKDAVVTELLGLYQTMVTRRGGIFQLDEPTSSKIEKVSTWIYESQKRGLMLIGTMGNGKTTMLLSLLYFFGEKATLYEASSLFDKIKKEKEIPQRANNDILLIDDLGVEPPYFNDFGITRYPLAEVLLKRYRDNKITVIVTNLSLDQIGQIYGDRVRERMIETFAAIQYTEPSYRTQKMSTTHE